MTDNERFELLWNHYHKQIDENLTVHRALNELRENRALLEKTAEYALKCQTRMDKMAFFLGITWANMKDSQEYMRMHNLDSTDESKEIIKRLDEALNELFYGKV